MVQAYSGLVVPRAFCPQAVHASSRVLECRESFVSVADKRQAHLGILFGRYLLGMCSVHRTVILLRNFIDWEVADIDVRGQLRFERCSNLPQLVPNNSTEEWVFLDLRRAVMSTALLP